MKKPPKPDAFEKWLLRQQSEYLHWEHSATLESSIERARGALDVIEQAIQKYRAFLRRKKKK